MYAEPRTPRSDYCPRCGGHRMRINAECRHCGYDLNEFDRLVKSESDEVLLVGGRGYGHGGAISDVFHAIEDRESGSVCGRLSAEYRAEPGEGIEWTKWIRDLDGTRRWQSRPCKFCLKAGAFDNHGAENGEYSPKEDTGERP